MTLRAFIILIIIAAPGHSVVFSSELNFVNETSQDNDVWTTCWHPEDTLGDVSELGTKLASCVKSKMYHNLVSYVDQQCVDIGDGVTYVSSNEHPGLSARDLFPLGDEPSSYRGLADAYSSFLSRRGVRWDLGNLYPGLVMRVGPTINGDGVLEFVMDRRLDYNERAKLGPGQQVIRRTILPHLLGFRMNLLTMLPLVFGVLVYVAKNAFIFSKLTLVISTLLALKSLFVLQHLRPPQYGHPNDVIDTPGGIGNDHLGFIGGPKLKPHTTIHPENFVLQMFNAAVPPFRGVNDKGYDDEKRGERNFSWQK